MTFSRAAVTLPTVIGLRIQCPGAWCFLVKACPNTEILILRDNLRNEGLMEEARELKRLRHIEFYDSYWIADDIERLHEKLPSLESLALKGGIAQEDILVSIEPTFVLRCWC